MPNYMLSLSIAIVIVIVIAIAALLTGLRIVIQRFFDIFIEKKLFFVYLIFNIILIAAMFLFIFFNFFGGGLTAVVTIIFSILFIAIVEYVFIYKRNFDYEPGGKYLLCMIVSYFFNFMFLVLISNLLVIVLVLLLG